MTSPLLAIAAAWLGSLIARPGPTCSNLAWNLGCGIISGETGNPGSAAGCSMIVAYASAGSTAARAVRKTALATQSGSLAVQFRRLELGRGVEPFLLDGGETGGRGATGGLELGDFGGGAVIELRIRELRVQLSDLAPDLRHLLLGGGDRLAQRRERGAEIGGGAA